MLRKIAEYTGKMAVVLGTAAVMAWLVVGLFE